MVLLIRPPVRPVVGTPVLPRTFQTGLAVLLESAHHDRSVRRPGHIPHAGVQPHGIPVHLQMIKLGAQDRRRGTAERAGVPVGEPLPVTDFHRQPEPVNETHVASAELAGRPPAPTDWRSHLPAVKAKRRAGKTVSRCTSPLHLTVPGTGRRSSTARTARPELRGRGCVRRGIVTGVSVPLPSTRMTIGLGGNREWPSSDR